ncbi:unnamed protein product [Arctia plantaginis]|uniref:Uncharacterized protein n=1 Tax=Arctia plantaginis TaxID=874455 RepID=A0A8S1AG44_ARCPL|nr:unnamed protein product [Arctia plantaginis]
MSDLKVCRICLRTEAKMYNFNLYQLKFYYEEVMALKVNEDDGFPSYFCYECATMLHKFHKFKEKCYVGQKILKELLWKGPITYELVYKVDRKDLMLESPLSIMTSGNHVKIYITKENSKQKDHLQLLPKIENMELEFLNEVSFSDGDNLNELTDDEKFITFNDQDKISSISDNDKIQTQEENTQNDNDIINEDRIASDNNIKVDDEKTSDDGDDEMKNAVENNDIPNSPMTVYVETENGVLITDCEELKKVHRGKKLNTWKVQSLNDKKNWKIEILSEEEALKEFRAKAEDKKYLAAAFKCKDCFKGFSKKDMLKRHVQLRHIEELGSHECRFCRYRYRLDCYLKKHMKQHYTRYNCLRCDLQCPLENTALLHEEYHSGVTRKCTYCNEEFRHSSTYYTHLRTHRSEHVCTLCGASFVSAIGLRQHRHIKHVLADIESPDDDEEVNTYCKRCDIRFETRKAYEEHLFHSALHSDEDGKGTAVNKVNKRSDSSEKISVSKKVLSKREQAKITKRLSKRNNDDADLFNVKRLVKRYKRKERRQRTKPTTCHQCGEHFDTQAACLKHHIEAHPRTSFHPPTERYICEICGSSLAPGSIAMHQNMHSREKLHTCDTCGKQFHAIVGLKRHMVTHTGEKPYACSLCDKRFTQSNSMKLHYRTFHLKQPYPKRNRRKQKNEPKETVGGEETNTEDSSDESLAEAEPQDRVVVERTVDVVTDRNDDTMHYLTLT